MFCLDQLPSLNEPSSPPSHTLRHKKSKSSLDRPEHEMPHYSIPSQPSFSAPLVSTPSSYTQSSQVEIDRIQQLEQLVTAGFSALAHVTSSVENTT